jgi:periplasmic divalent cation tolerance protein
MTTTDVVVVLCTFPAGDQAAQVARTVVEEGLAACVNLVAPVRSIYRWEGATCDDVEQLAIIKTTASGFEALRARLIALHPYAVAEVIALPVTAGSEAYLDWVRGAVSARR